MGNSLHIPFLGNNGSHRLPCRLQLPSAAIDLSMQVPNEDNGLLREEFDVSYTVDGSTCKLLLRRHVDKDNNIIGAFFSIIDCVYLDCGYISFGTWNTRGHGIVHFTETNEEFQSVVTSKTTSVGFTTTTIYFYGWSGNRRGLVIEEVKTNSKDQKSKEITVAHYLASYRSKETDIGFSLVAKVHEYNDGKREVAVEGPEQHPASALFYMFDEVNRTGSWKPTMCPHCDQNRRNHCRTARQSDTEDSDNDRSRQIAKRIDNRGRFKGHANGSFIWCKNLFGFSLR